MKKASLVCSFLLLLVAFQNPATAAKALTVPQLTDKISEIEKQIILTHLNRIGQPE